MRTMACLNANRGGLRQQLVVGARTARSSGLETHAEVGGGGGDARGWWGVGAAGVGAAMPQKAKGYSRRESKPGLPRGRRIFYH